MAIAVRLADLCWMILRKRRRALEQNLRYLAPERAPGEHRQLARATFRNLARCSVDLLRVPSMSRAELLGLADWHGREHLDRALARGKGVVLVAGHVGNWELAGIVLAALGYPLHAIAEDRPATVFRLYQRYRAATGMTIIPLSRGGLLGARVLRRGRILALVSDRVIAGRSSLDAHFCGGRRALPIGPARLARRFDAPIVAMHVVLNPAGRRRYLGTIEPVIEDPEQCDDRQLTQAFADRMSRILRQHPDQWFVFQPDWLPRTT